MHKINQHIIRFLTLYLIFLIVLISIPTFFKMLHPGIFSMHDFHIFRMFEYHKCISDFVFPCRWAPDSGFGYGEPLFNFYGQLPYILGEPLVLIGFSILTTIKLLFIFSILASAVLMYMLVKYLFKSDFAAILSSILYVYAPYRAVDIWVRGALPESLSFVFFPAILLFATKYLKEEKFKNLLIFSLLLAGLIINHNLSFLMFVPFLAVWVLHFIIIDKKYYLIKNLALASILTIGIASFYLIPVIFESKLVTISETTNDYYNFRAHFTTLNQLLISRSWGYGASQFGPDDNLSFLAGQIHWILSIFVLVFILVSMKFKQYLLLFLTIFLGWIGLFLTHGKSAPLWEKFSPLSFVQFPWRFLTMSTLFLSLSGGSVLLLLKNKYLKLLTLILIITLTIGLNFSFFKEDLWFKINDQQQFSSSRWQEQIASALTDFWPKSAPKIPNREAPQLPTFINGNGQIVNFEKYSHSATVQVKVTENNSSLQLPTVYFPGWKGYSNNKTIDIYPSGDYGQITTNLSQGEYNLKFKFANTPVRIIGNLISLTSLVVVIIIFFKDKFSMINLNLRQKSYKK